MPECTDIQAAAAQLRQGGVILYPTETFWGLGCQVFSETAIARVYALKKRTLNKALPLIAGDFAQVDMVAVLDAHAHALAESFWPAPLSLLLPVRKQTPVCLSAGTGKIVIRLSGHPVARELALLTGVPLVSTSANLSGEAAVRNATELHPELIRQTELLLTLPPVPAGGQPSSIVEVLSANRLRLVREGAIPRKELEAKGYDCEEIPS